MIEDSIKELHLIDELTTASKLIEIGFGELQNLNLENDFYFIPLQLISSGFERLMKCHICLGYFNKTKSYPDFTHLKSFGGRNGHDLLELKKYILKDYFNQFKIPVLVEDYNYLDKSEYLNNALYLLSEFGKYARYYNLDVVTASTKPSINVINHWFDFEIQIAKSNPDIYKKLDDLELQSELVHSVNREIIILLEKFTRGICRQFTIGKLGEKASQYSPILFSWIFLKDDKLGNKDYRKNTVYYKNKELKVHRRTFKDELDRRYNKNYKSKVITKEEFKEDWPFYHDSVIIECREKNWCIVTIEDKDYALNGAAVGRFKLEHVHDAGMAILGKSVYPFIDMALKL